MRVVLTGFGPFGPHDRNPSWEVAQAAAAALVEDGHEAEAVELPVTYEVAASFAAQRLGDGPALLLHVGLAGRRAEICFERYAHNERTPDESIGEDTNRATCVPIAADGPVARRCELPLDDWARRWNEAGVLPRARVSRDCGDYVCNATLYASLAAVEARGDGARAGFVHVPPMDVEVACAVGRRLASLLGAWMGGEFLSSTVAGLRSQPGSHDVT